MRRLMLFAILVHAAAAEVKLAVVDGYAFVQVMVNGKGPFRMLVDTGASSCALTPQAAARAGMVYDHRVVVATAAGERIVPSADATLSVGNIEARRTEVLAHSIDAVRQLDYKADGVLGQSFLARFPYLIDYKRKRLLIGGEAEEQSRSLGSAVPAEQVDGRMVVPVALAEGGKPWRLALDSGSRRVLLECAAGCPRMERSGTGRIVTNTGDRTVDQGVLKRIAVGDLSIARPEALLVHNPPVVGREDGLLPARLFSAVYVDAEKHQVRLSR